MEFAHVRINTSMKQEKMIVKNVTTNVKNVLKKENAHNVKIMVCLNLSVYTKWREIINILNLMDQ